MAADQGTPEKAEVGSGDIIINERGEVEIANVRLADLLKAMIAAEQQGQGRFLKDNGCNNHINVWCFAERTLGTIQPLNTRCEGGRV